MNPRLDELMRAADPVDPAAQPPVTGGNDDPLYLAILERSGNPMTLHEKTKPTRTPVRSRTRGWAMAGAAFALAVAAGTVVAMIRPAAEPAPPAATVSTPDPVTTTQPPATTTSVETPPTEPGAVIEYLYEVLLDDPASATAVFVEDAVIKGVGGSPNIQERKGTAAIRPFLALQSRAMESIEITRIEVSGETVTWDDRALQTSCFGGPACVVEGTGHVAVVRDGKIVTWDLGSLDFITD